MENLSRPTDIDRRVWQRTETCPCISFLIGFLGERPLKRGRSSFAGVEFNDSLDLMSMRCGLDNNQFHLVYCPLQGKNALLKITRVLDDIYMSESSIRANCVVDGICSAPVSRDVVECNGGKAL